MHFSMRVDQSDFFNDARSYSLVFVDTFWENLKDLQDHMQNLFQLVGRKQRSSLTFNIKNLSKFSNPPIRLRLSI